MAMSVGLAVVGVVPVAGPKLRTQISKLWVHDPCVRRKPLGTPVLPEVKPM